MYVESAAVIPGMKADLIPCLAQRRPLNNELELATMNITKYLLYGALAAISYVMLLAWNTDYPQVVDFGAPAPSPVPLISPPENTTVTDIPTQFPDSPVSSTSSESVAVSEANESVTVSEPTANISSTTVISVSTDTLEIDIDLIGGDITYLALPKHLRQLDVSNDPFVLLESSPGRNYVAQSGLIGRDGIDNSGRAVYQSSSTSYRLNEDENALDVDLVTTTAGGVQVTKRFGFNRGSYLIDVTFIVDNQSGAEWQGNAFGQVKRDAFDDPSGAGFFSRSYLGFVATSDDDPYIKIPFGDVADGTGSVDMNGGWIGFSQKYFLSAWIPSTETTNRFNTRINNINQYFGEFTSSSFAVPARSTGSQTVRFYAGPKDQNSLAEISPNLDLNVDYGFLWFLANPIYWLLAQINSIIGNYGVSIIILTFIVKGLLFKLSEKQFQSMAGMRRLMPKMQQLKDSYADDKMKLQQATMALYKKEKINPLGGCLPLLAQMPVFIALYWVLLESVELRHAPFVFWLNDLSVRDPFFVLPLLMGITMFLQMRLNPPPADPMQAKIMQFMPVMMTAMFLFFQSGLVLYWLTNSVLGILQQWYITRKIEASYEAKKAT